MYDWHALYALVISNATAAIRDGIRQAPTEQQRDLWFAMLERLAMIERMEEGNA